MKKSEKSVKGIENQKERVYTINVARRLAWIEKMKNASAKATAKANALVVIHRGVCELKKEIKICQSNVSQE